MILGVGTDIIEIDRIKNAIDNTPGFLEKVFTEREVEELSKNTLNTISRNLILFILAPYSFNTIC